MLYRGSHDVREPQLRIDGFLTDIANPVVKIKQLKVINLVPLGVYRAALWGVVLTLIPALRQEGHPFITVINTLEHAKRHRSS